MGPSQMQPQLDPTQLAQMLGGDPYGGGQGGMPGPGVPQGPPPTGAAGGPTTPPMGAGADLMGQSGQQGSPADQAIWSIFPSTDPNVAQQFFPQGGGGQELAQGIMAWEQAAEQDRMAFEQRQKATLQMMVGMLTQPDQGQALQSPGPGTGGEGTGY